MKRIGILLLCCTLGCTAHPRFPPVVQVTLDRLPALDDSFPIPESERYSTMTGSSQTYPYREVWVDGVLYTVASNREGHVAFIATSDPKFRTPEGLSLQSSLEDVTAAGAKPPWAEPGWAYHTKLPSGWEAAFTCGCEMTGCPLKTGQKVDFFFQR
jgi:hypothetical protein